MKELWNLIIKSVFENKPSLINEIVNNTKLVDDRNGILKIRIFKNYLEKIIEKNIKAIKSEYEKNKHIPVSKIYLNNKKINFAVTPKKTKAINSSIDKNSIANFVGFSNGEILDEKTIIREASNLLLNKKIVLLSFYNKLLFSGKDIELYSYYFSYKKFLKYAIYTSFLLIPPLVFLGFYFIRKLKIKEIKDEIDSLVSLQYESLNKDTKILLEYIKILSE